VTILTRPATPERWDDVVTAFGRRGDDPGWCWCQRFFEAPPDDATPKDNRAALRHEVASASVPPGILAYVDGNPAGWTRVMPRSAVTAVARNRALSRILADDPAAWWVTCFAVDRRYRSIGVATELLNAAVAHARQHGASAIEGHPVDAAALQAEHVSGSALFTGTLRTFIAAGFREIGRTYPSRPVMRLDL
jgi:GNAT superfamily N-acetyltransferase